MASHSISDDPYEADDQESLEGHTSLHEVTIRFFNNSRQGEARHAQMVPNDLSRHSASEDMHIDLLGS